MTLIRWFETRIETERVLLLEIPSTASLNRAYTRHLSRQKSNEHVDCLSATLPKSHAYCVSRRTDGEFSPNFQVRRQNFLKEKSQGTEHWNSVFRKKVWSISLPLLILVLRRLFTNIFLILHHNIELF